MKVKHYKSYYRKKNNALAPVIVALVVIALAVAGFFSFKYLLTPTPDTPSDTSSATVSEPTTSDTQSEKTPLRTSAVRAAFLSPDVASDLDKLANFITQAKEKGITDVIVTVKDSVGYLYYDTAYRPAAYIKNRSEQMYDLLPVVQALHNNSLNAVAHMHCFSDRLGTRIKNAGVLYSENHSVVWLDDDKANGGKSWLNPYSDQAVTYLNYIADEMVKMGFDTVMLDSVRFPGGYQNYAYYGENLSTREECLRGFVTELKQHLKEKEVDLWLYASTDSYVDPIADIYTENVFTLGADTVLVDVMPKNFKHNLAFSSVQIENPIQHPDKVVGALVELALTKSGNVRVIPVLQGYTDPTVEAQYNLTYTSEHLESQLMVLDKIAISDYAVYSPNSDLELLQ